MYAHPVSSPITDAAIDGAGRPLADQGRDEMPATPPTFDLDGARREAKLANRRRSVRYSAVKDHLWAGWWADDEFVLVEADLINISEGGVMLAISPTPAVAQPVWIRLEGSAVTESLRGLVLESRWTRLKRRYAVRLAFQTSCPTGFFQTAVFGRPISD